MSEPTPEMRNPFRNEADAFRVLMMIVVAAAIVIAASILVDGRLGAALGLIAIALGLYSAGGWLRAGLAERPDDDPEKVGPSLNPPPPESASQDPH